MSVPISILLFGRNTRLLESRTMALRSVVYRVHMASDLSTGSHMLRKAQIESLILCHSLPMEDRCRALALNYRLPMMRSLAPTAGEGLLSGPPTHRSERGRRCACGAGVHRRHVLPRGEPHGCSCPLESHTKEGL
jgi:hypothetical protein